MVSKKPSAKRSGHVTPAVKQYVKKQMRTNSELKRYERSDQEKIEGTTSNPLYFSELALIEEGTDVSERIGTQIRLQGVQLKGMFNNNSAVVNYVRYAIGYILDPTAVAIGGGTKFFRGPFNNQLSTAEVYASGAQPYALMTTPFHPDVFQALYDKVHKIGPSSSTDGNNSRLINKFIKLHNRKVEFPNANVVGFTGQALPRLVVCRWYTDAGQDAGAVLQPIEYSGRSIVWYRDI